MFDVYMHAHAIDPRARQRMMALFCVATVATAVSIGSAMVGERLGISRVGPPKIEGLLVLPMEMVAAPLEPPPPKLEPKPETDAAQSASTAALPKPHERSDSELAPLDDPDATDPPTTRKTAGPDIGGQGPLRPQSSTPSLPCLVPGACSTTPVSPRPTPAIAPRTFESIEVARERALASPDPPTDQLARTPAGIARRNASSRVAFCIGTDGKTTDVRTRKSSGDPEVDRICRDTVARRWRFQPFLLDARARTTCSEVTFQIAFE